MRKDQTVRVASVQAAPVIADPLRNRDLAVRLIRESLDLGAEVIVLPELMTTGYHLTPEEARTLAEAASGPSISAWSEALRDTDAIVIGGFCELGPHGEIFNSAAVVSSAGVLAVYRKTHLWDQEHRLFEVGTDSPPVIETPRGRIGVAICYDLFFPELTRGLALSGAELLVVPTNSPWPGERAPGAPGDQEGIGHAIARSAAYVNRVFVAVSDRHGDERGRHWTSRSSIIDPEGRFVAGPVGYQEEILLADCDLGEARGKQWEGTQNDAFADRRPELYGDVTRLE